MKTDKSVHDFIAEHRAELDRAITHALTRYDKPGFVRHITLNDEERRLWVLNDQRLYNFERSEGVRI